MKKIVAWSNDGVCISDDCVWFIPFGENLLCRYNLVEDRLLNYFMLDEWEDSSAISYNLMSFNDEIIIIPARGKKYYLFNANGRVDTFYIGDNSLEKYKAGIKLDDCALFFPKSENAIVKFDENGFTRIMNNVTNVLSCCRIGTVIYFVDGTGIIYSFEYENMDIQKRKTAFEKIIYISEYNGDLVLLTKTGEVVLYRIDDSKENDMLVKNDVDYFSSCVCRDDTLYLLPYREGNAIWTYNFKLKRRDMILIDYSMHHNGNWKYNSYGMPIVYNGIIYSMSPKYQSLIKIDISNNVEFVCLNINEKEIENYSLILNEKKHNCTKESEWNSLINWIAYISD